MPSPATADHVAFIRAIMIGRQGLHREVVLDLFRDAGARDPVSHLATGIVSFGARPRDLDGIVGHVEAGIEAIAGRPKLLYVRPLAHLVAMVDADPFAAAPVHDAPQREVVFMQGRVPPLDLPVMTAKADLCIFAAGDRELFAVSRVEPPGGVIERLTGEPVTVRAWSTVTRIVRTLTASVQVVSGDSAD
jgi:uncharacterized protein (DUF1697 family)